MASHSITINCTADTYVDLYNVTANYGNSSVARVGGHNPGVTGNYKYYPFFGFDISSIPANKTITGLYLMFRLISISTEYPPAQVVSGSNTNLPFVVKTRRVYGYKFEEIETTLSKNTVSSMTGSDNLFATPQSGLDTSLNISALAGYDVIIPINDITRPASNKIVVAMLMDTYYNNDRMYFYHGVISTKDGMYAPVLMVDYDDYVPSAPTNLTPNNSARNAAGAIQLSWQFYDELSTATQASFELVYSTDGFATSTTATGATESNYIIPADTFAPGKTVQWKVRITDTEGGTSDWSSIASIPIGSTPPSAPEPISPSNTIVNSSDEIYFQWRFKDLYGYSQSKFDFEYRKGIDAAVTVSGVSVNTYYVLSAKTLVGGDYSWRVRCYNTFGEIGPYTPWTSFYSIGQPDLPIITSVSNNMHPTIKWTSKEQDLFIAKIYIDNILLYDSGEQISKESNEFMIPEFLNNGNYKLGLKISNVYGFWSNEVLYPFIISTTKPTKPSIAGSTNNLFIALIVTSTTVNNLIYRKGIKDKEFKMIAELHGNSFLDYSAAAGRNEYFVRAITQNGYIDSNVISLDLSFNGVILAGAKNQKDLINLWKTKDSDKRKSIIPSKYSYLVNCNGRTYPLSQTTEFKNHAESHEYFIYQEQYDDFYRIVTEYNTLLYRNNYGYSYIVELTNLSLSENTFGYVVSFTLTRLEE